MKIKGACSHPCKLQKVAKQVVIQKPIQDGPEQKQEQDQQTIQKPKQIGPEQKQEQDQQTIQKPKQEGPEQNQEQDQNTVQIPIQDGPEQNQEQDQNTAQIPIQDGPEQNQDQEQNTAQIPVQDGPELNQGQEQNTAQIPVQDGPELNQGQEQNTAQIPVQDGPELNQGQEQNTAQIPVQDGPEVDQTQNTTQNPVIFGPEPDQNVDQQTDTITTLNTTTTTTPSTTVTPNTNLNTTTTTTPTTTVTPNTTTTPTANQSADQTQTGTQTQDGTQNQGAQNQQQSHGDQTQGSQTIAGHTNTSPLNNSQTISTPTTVSGVTVNVECKCNKEKVNKIYKKKNRKWRKDKCNDSCAKGCKPYSKNCDCDCCDKALADLLTRLQAFQANIIPPEEKQVDIYLNTTVTPNPITNQVITNVNDCATVTFRDADNPLPTPNTTFQLSKVAGVRAEDNVTTTTDAFSFLVNYANTCPNLTDSQTTCKCGSCSGQPRCCEANTLATDLQSSITFGSRLNLYIKGLPTTIDDVYVYRICGCLAFFVDDLVTPTTIYAYTLCSISGFTVPTP
ncbi:hypothetical protein [Bacillus sp. CGMCC 1.16541]|uniref:hypothetical protein n=1 Tax=Bacillus sp. CGMCC 1.16541 TaxID=2185143 RepID=UPI000D736970|nr:hypothetical protein [Bacillus sp. CGMCC 1.16541]